MSNIFETIGLTKPRKSAFDLSHEKKLSCKMGDLIPIYLDEVVPGDHFQVNSEIMIRLAPMLAPMMHRVDVYCHYFFVPNRIIWSEWEEFITGGKDGLATPTFPQVPMEQANFDGYIVPGTLGDYMGLPQADDVVPPYDPLVSQMPFRAYTQIYNDYFVDPNVGPIESVDPPQGAGIYAKKRRAWGKDYFTSCLPWPQRGPQVDLPIDFNYANPSKVIAQDDTDLGVLNSNITTGNLSSAIAPTGTTPARIENLEEDGVTVSINELRSSNRLQEWLEKQARGGHRYIETILSHFGVKSSDKRLQRAEYLGGGRQPIVISEVLQTSETVSAGGNTPQGNMAGHGIAVGKYNKFKKHFEEHGYVMGIMSVLPKTTYQQGIPRHFLRKDKLDFYWPSFAHLGEQAVQNQELYYQWNGTAGQQEGTFGYQQRYAEYKYKPSTVHGDFKTNLDFWHMGRKFTAPPQLNEEFMKSDPTDRIFAVQDGTDTL